MLFFIHSHFELNTKNRNSKTKIILKYTLINIFGSVEIGYFWI